MSGVSREELLRIADRLDSSDPDFDDCEAASRVLRALAEQQAAQMALEDAVRAVVEKHGGVRAAGRATGVDGSFISRLMNGHKVAPGKETLRLLGLRAVPLYEVFDAYAQPQQAAGHHEQGAK